jgi:IS5 family transposase
LSCPTPVKIFKGLEDQAAVFGDKAYDQAGRGAELRRRGVFCSILAQASKRRPLKDKKVTVGSGARKYLLPPGTLPSAYPTSR